MISLSDAISLLCYLFILCRMKLHTLNLWLSNGLNRHLTLLSISSRSLGPSPVHTILVLGDGCALGVGDGGVTFGGTGGLAIGLLNSIFSSPDVRRKWAVVVRESDELCVRHPTPPRMMGT